MYQFFGRRLAAAIDEGDFRPLAGQGLNDGPADPPAPARHQGHLILERHNVPSVGWVERRGATRCPTGPAWRGIVIFAVGFNFSIDNLIFDFADANPDSQFVWIDGWNQGQENLKPIAYSMNQSSFLAGYLAAAYSESKTIGTYGGMNIPAVTDFMTGYYNGAKYYEAETGTPVTVLGWDPATPDQGDFVGDFANTAAAQSISEGQLAAGADVFFPVAGGLFTATATVIRDAGNGVLIGVDKDIATTQPELADITLTSVEKRMTQAVFDVIADLSGGGAFTIDPYVGTLENDGTALSDFGSFDVSADIQAKLDEIKAGIIDGSIDPLVTP